MPSLDVSKITKLLTNHRVDEARTMLADFFAGPLPPADRVSAQLALAAAYAEFKTEINETYSELLIDALVRLKRVKAFERESKDQIDLARVNAEIDILSKKK